MEVTICLIRIVMINIAKYDNFRNFILYGIHNKNIKNIIHFKPQTDFIFSNDNICMVDNIVRFENIKSEYKIIKKKLNGERLLKYKVSRVDDDYKNYYNDEMIEKIETL